MECSCDCRHLWNGQLGLVIVIATSMVIAMVVAGVTGALCANYLEKLGKDPAEASSILLTTVTDIAGFFSFLEIATLLPGMLTGGAPVPRSRCNRVIGRTLTTALTGSRRMRRAVIEIQFVSGSGRCARLRHIRQIGRCGRCLWCLRGGLDFIRGHFNHLFDHLYRLIDHALCHRAVGGKISKQ